MLERVRALSPGKNDNERSPITEVNEALLMTGDPEDKVLARQYRPKKFFTRV